MRRALAALALIACSAALAGCGEDDPSPGENGGEIETLTINVTFEGDSVTPNGDRVTVKVDQPIELVVKADAAGEIHVHSEPEQQLEYAAGTTTLPLTPITKPGVVEVESHDLEKVIVQLEVEG